MAIQPDMIGIVVRDLDKALAFYRMLGLDVPEDVVGEQHVEVITPNGYRIAWDSAALIKSLYPDWIEPQGQGITLAFKCDSSAEVDALYERLLAAGYNGFKEPWDAVWGQRYAVVDDPDGNHVDLFAAL